MFSISERAAGTAYSKLSRHSKNKILLSILVFTGWFLMPAAVFASSCFEDCINATACTAASDDAYCSDTNSRCQTDCLAKIGKKSYGAIAYSRKDEAFGYSDS